MAKYTERIFLAISPEDKRELEAIAEASDRTLSGVARLAFRGFLHQHTARLTDAGADGLKPGQAERNYGGRGCDE